jgi:hypothetical protein
MAPTLQQPKLSQKTLGGILSNDPAIWDTDEALNYLAKTLVEAYLKQKRYDRTKQPQ